MTNKFNDNKIKIVENKCKNCSLCKENCPNNVITINKQKQAIESDECLYCFKCQDVCEFAAISYQKK